MLAAYGAPDRSYHGVGHLAAVLVTLDELWPHPDRPVPPPVRAAAWFHDAIYDPAAADNEARSAAWARIVLEAAGVGRQTVAVAAGLVEATAAHRLVGSLVGTPGAASFLDADLAILGAPPEVYDRYMIAIRAEYRHLDDDDVPRRARQGARRPRGSAPPVPQRPRTRSVRGRGADEPRP